MKISASIILIAFIHLMSNSCEKDSKDTSKNITGEWFWIKSITVYPSEAITPENMGVYEILLTSTQL